MLADIQAKLLCKQAGWQQEEPLKFWAPRSAAVPFRTWLFAVLSSQQAEHAKNSQLMRAIKCTTAARQGCWHDTERSLRMLLSCST